MAKYGKANMGAPDVSQDIAALKDLYAKGEITKDIYQSKLARLQRERMSYIVATNGRFIPGRRLMKKYNQAMESLVEAKQKNEIFKQQQNRDQYLSDLSKLNEEKPEE
jgi:hypothetical protein